MIGQIQGYNFSNNKRPMQSQRRQHLIRRTNFSIQIIKTMVEIDFVLIVKCL